MAASSRTVLMIAVGRADGSRTSRTARFLLRFHARLNFKDLPRSSSLSAIPGAPSF